MSRLIQLDTILNQKISSSQYKKDAKRNLPIQIKEVISLIRRNKFDYNNIQHKYKLSIAIKYGYVDENLNILKEER